MAELNQKNINIGLAAGILLVLVILVLLDQVGASGVDQALDGHGARITALEEATSRISEQNDELLAYLDEYHGGDKQRGDDLAKIKVLLEDHQARIDRIVQTIKELH